jgi:hypothetical protein
MIRKRVSNDDSLKSPTFDGDITPNDDNKWTLGTPMKRLKAVYASNLVSSLTNFLNIALTATLNQITLGTGTTTTISAPTPADSQVVTIPDSGTSTTNVILQDSGTQQNINSNLNIANNALVTGSSTFLKAGLFQVQPNGSSKSVIQVLGWGPGANAYEFNAGNLASLAAPVAPAQYLTDDVSGDTVVVSNASNAVYPNAAIRMGFAGSATALSIVETPIPLY